MAVTTNYKKQEETAKNTQQVQSAQPYQGMNGVSKNTANNLGNYQQGYKQSEQVQQAQQNLQNVQAQKPQTYNSKYSAQLDSIMQQIQNPQKFSYEFNGDNLFKAYADQYHQNAKQASADVMGQAAALTGGYGNSYAQAAGNQAYQQQMLQLYDKGLDLYDRAYQNYQNQLGNQKDIYNMLQGADATDYGRYRDTVGDWQTEEEQAYNRLQNAQNFDYQDYQNALDYYTGLAQIENAAYNTEAQRQEAIRQYDQNYAENVRQYDTDNAYRYDTLNWQKDTDARDFAENVRQNDIANAMNERKQDYAEAADKRDFDENQRLNNMKYAAQYAMAILENGQMPSAEMLEMAGLSPEDAQKLLAEAQQVIYSPASTPEDKKHIIEYIGEKIAAAGESLANYLNNGKTEGVVANVKKYAVGVTPEDQVQKDMENTKKHLGR